MSNWRKVDDIQLLKIAQKGDAEAFGEIYERHAQKVFRFLYAHLMHRRDAEDLTEEVFIRVWRALPGYREQGTPFMSFVFRIARNVMIDHYRHDRHTMEQVSSEDVTIRDPEPGPVELMQNEVQRQELVQALEGLREDYRLVLVMRFLSDLNPEETARAMGRSAGAVRVLQHRALIALRANMDRLRENPDE
jgi:RNA polymerase sigma-70 factor (ECF subfamily)